MKTNTLKSTFAKAALIALAVTGLSNPRASAQNPNYAPGDVVLFFQQFGGTNTVMLNIGAGVTFRDATSNMIDIANIGSLLSAAPGSGGFGSSWYELTNLWWGAAGVRTDSTTTTHVNGDAGRTLYVSSVRTSVGTEGTAASAGWTVDSSGSMTTGASNIIAVNNRLETLSGTTTLVEGTASSFIDDQNPFNILGTPTDSFGIFPGSVLGNFGAGSFGNLGGVAAEGALDLYRILAVSNANTTEPGPIREGQFQGTFIINQTGSVSYIAPIPEPATTGLLASSLVFGLVRRRRAVRA
jgi:hypothetical protein